MNDLFKISKLKEAVSDYLKVKFELFKLDITEHLSNILAQVIAYVVILLMAWLVIGFLSLGIASLLNELLDSQFLGELIVSGFYLIILLIVYAFLKSGKLKAAFEKMIMENVPEKESTKTEDE